MKRVLVAGSRTFTKYDVASKILDRIKWNSDDSIVSGCASGADAMGELYAHKHNIRVMRFPADWDKYGRAAGYKRNYQMAKVATHAIVFWDGESPGSKMMIELLKQHNVKFAVFDTCGNRMNMEG